jgi:hypothetical protein
MKKSGDFAEVLYFVGVPHGPHFEPKPLEQNQSSGLETQNLAQLRALLVELCS